MDIEEIAIGHMLEPKILTRIKMYLDPDVMFYHPAYRALATIMKYDSNVNGFVPKEIIPYMQEKYKNLTPNDIQKLHDVLNNRVEIESIKTALKVVESYMVDRLISRASLTYVTKNPGYRDEALSYFRKAENINLDTGKDFIQVNSLEDLKRVRDEDFPSGSKPIPSSIYMINEKLTHKGYKYGDLCMIVAPPKVGKTTFMIQEGCKALQNDLKVLHIAIGDMTASDVYLKYINCLHEVSDISSVTHNVEHYYGDVKRYIDNLLVKEEPAMMMTIEELVSCVKAKKEDFDFDMVIIDYDANISPAKDGMYESGGIIYSSLKGMAQDTKSVVLIGSQPNKDSWNKEPLPADSAAESSRKQQAVDIMITIARNAKDPNVGTLALPLVRRGESNVETKVRFDYLHGRITSIASSEYQDSTDGPLSTKDIDIDW